MTQTGVADTSIEDLYTVYIDTDVFHYLALGPPPANQHVMRTVTELANAVQNGSVICVTSTLALAEEYDIRKGRAFIQREIKRENIRWTSRGVLLRNPEAAQPLDSPARARAVRVVRQGLANSVVRLDDPPGWPTALIDLFGRRSNMHWPDALHLAMALAMRCDYFLTGDKQFHEEIVQRLTTGTRPLHHAVATVLASEYGLPSERLQPPLVQPLYLRDPGTSAAIASLAPASGTPASN